MVALQIFTNLTTDLQHLVKMLTIVKAQQNTKLLVIPQWTTETSSRGHYCMSLNYSNKRVPVMCVTF